MQKPTIRDTNRKEVTMSNKNNKHVLDLLIERGYIDSTTSGGEEKLGVTNLEKIRDLLDGGTTIYQGFDPSGSSLHLGHLLGIMALHHLQEAGNKIVFLLGGATGRVGDPTDKNSTRKLLTTKVVENNAKSMKKQVEDMGLLSFEEEKALMLNNEEWIAPEPFLDYYLVEIARNFSVNDLVKMDTFKKRLDNKKHLSLMEFLYPTLQAWDFLHLYKKYNCRIQVGGSDQWGNILQGVNLIKAHEGQKTDVQAITFPLLLTSNGEKMGKTEKGPLWLDPNKTSPFEFYQYIEKTTDDMVGQLFKLYTFLELDEINKIMGGNPRDAQKRLAFEVTKLVHGEKEARKAQKDSEGLYSKDPIHDAKSIPEITVKNGSLLEDTLITSESLSSKSEVRRRCEGGAIKINGAKIEDPKTPIADDCTIQYGKSKFLKVKVN